MFSKIFEISIFQKIFVFFFRSRLCRLLTFDLLNRSFCSFFMNRSGFSRRIRIFDQIWQQNSVGKVILHFGIVGLLSKETILNIAQFREITLDI